MNKREVSILGTIYTVVFDVPVEEMPEGSDGCIDQSIKQIKIAHFNEPTLDSLQDNDSYRNKVLRHEIIHAFLYESGLWNNTVTFSSWAISEEMTDWIAIQFPKISKVFKQLGCEE